MMTENDVRRAFREAVVETISERGTFPRAYVISLVLDRVSKPHGKSADFDLVCRYYTAKDMLDRIMREVTLLADDEEETQLALPLKEGCEHLRQAYSQKRDGEPWIVLLEDMRLEEGRARIRRMRRGATTQLKHADEMERYFDQRERAQAAAE